MNALQAFLEHKAYNLRLACLAMTTRVGSGHPTSCLSAADLIAAIFFYSMRYDPQDPDNIHNDRFILSKGHAAPLLYAVWKELGVLSDKDLEGYRTIGSPLEGHPTSRFSRTEAATGSLGIGLSIGAGMALALQRDKISAFVYVMLGDSEVSEGSVWEAAELAHFYKLNNMIAVLDCNRLGQSSETMHGHHVQRYVDKFHAFGWRTILIDGHNMHEIMMALDKVRQPHEQPAIIIAKTIKGYGVARVENKMGYHGKPFTPQELLDVLEELRNRFSRAALYDLSETAFKPGMPAQTEQIPSSSCHNMETSDTPYSLGDQIATRKAYGQSLAKLGSHCRRVVVLDAEVKNSTFSDLFEQKYPERFVQCFVAEQNMVSMAVGMHRCGKVPFISTFGAFFTRAHDQIRMAAIGKAALRLVGSHAGVAIGEDGPSQMALEDISMMQALPDSIVMYPSDGVSTHALVNIMAQYDIGISYLRTTRSETPIIYDHTEIFELGGCKVLRQDAQDMACVVGAGITLHEALKAYDALLEQGIYIAVIDLYSIKPIDRETLVRIGTQAGSRIITVEDHYIEGGLGSAVCYALRNTDIFVECLAVKELPRSGKSDELLAYAGINSEAIIKAVKGEKGDRF